MQSQKLTIGELAERVGVTPDTLRYYEHVRLLPPPPRSNGGYRLYEPGVADRVAFIRKAQALGLTLDDVREVLRVSDAGTPPCRVRRSEEHTSELQSHHELVCRLLLEKK